MRYSFLLMLLFLGFTANSQETNKHLSIIGKWELLEYNFDTNSFDSVGYTLEFIDDSICVKTEWLDDKSYQLNYRYFISSENCGQFETQVGDIENSFLVLNNETEKQTKCFLLSSIGRVEDEEDQNIYMNLYSFGSTSSIIFVKNCNVDTDGDGINDCKNKDNL